MTPPRLVALAVLPLAGCAGNPSALDPAGPGAGAILWLTGLFVTVGGGVYVVVLAIFAWAILRHRLGPAEPAPRTRIPAAPERRRIALITASLAGTALILSGFVGATFATDRHLLGLERDPTVSVTLTAHQWWWEIRYDDPVPANDFVTANELHVPVGEAVKITLRSTDVIHSLWVPNLTGKRDVIPGRDNTLWLTASEPGEWHGRCAEFCGYQHAHMMLRVIAEPRAAFDGWRAAQTLAAVEPVGDEARRGAAVFGESACTTCHVIRGTASTGYSATAPDLTHLKSRRSIAAGTLPNSKGHLGGWIIDPQSAKPGVHMPVNLLPAEDFQSLLAYLETLQ